MQLTVDVAVTVAVTVCNFVGFYRIVDVEGVCFYSLGEESDQHKDFD